MVYIFCLISICFSFSDQAIKINSLNINKQLLDEVEYDIMNYQNRGLCYLPKPSASADQIIQIRGFDNS